MLVAKIANGRLATMALTGVSPHDGLSGSAGGDWAPYMGSPLRTVESELGVQAPVGFWNPAGLSRDGGTEALKGRRGTEIKHGRVSMWACLGDLTSEYFKGPGYYSPSKGLALAGTPITLQRPQWPQARDGPRPPCSAAQPRRTGSCTTQRGPQAATRTEALGGRPTARLCLLGSSNQPPPRGLH